MLAPGGACISVDDGRPNLRREDLVLLGGLAAKGEFRPVIDRTYTLDEIVEAHRYVDTGHKRGNVVVSVGRAGNWSSRRIGESTGCVPPSSRLGVTSCTSARWPCARAAASPPPMTVRSSQSSTAPGSSPANGSSPWSAALDATSDLPPEQARARARLGLAVFRGLLLDLVGTGDQTAVDAAFEAYAALAAPAAGRRRP